MNIFHRRPLCIILCIMLGGFSVFPFLSPMLKALFASSALILVLISSFFYICNRKITLINVSSILLLGSILLSFFYFDFYAKCEDRFPGRATVVGKISELKVIDEDDRLISYTINTKKIGDKLAFYKLTFTTDKATEDITVGSNISLSGKISDFKATDDEMSDYYFSLGIMGTIEDITNITFKSQGLKPLSYYTSSIRDSLTRYSISVSNDSTGTLLSALLFGERQALSPGVKTDFTNIGISHILALSGMHVTLLCVAVNKLLLLLRVGKRERLIATIVLSAAYTVLTGMSISVVRAALMMIISQTLALLFKSNDSITSLSLSVFIIILFAPYSVYSVSLWLSAFATLGVIIALDFVDLIPYKSSIPRRILRIILTSALCSVFALVSTMLISSLVFGKFSMLSVISTLIFSLLTELIIYIGAIMLIIGKIIPISFILNPLVDLTLFFANKLATLKHACISTNEYIDAFLIITSIIFALAVIIRIRSKRAVLATVVTLLLVSTLPILVFGIVKSKESNIYYTSKFYEDVVIVKDEDMCHVISYGNTYRNNSYEIYDILLSENLHRIDTYILFEISENTPREISSLLAQVPINSVMIPNSKHDEAALAELTSCLDSNGVTLLTYDENNTYRSGNFAFLPLIFASDENDGRNIAYFVTLGDRKTMFLSSGILNDDNKAFLNGAIQSADTLILGRYGTAYPSNYHFDGYFENLDEIVFSGEKIYLTPDIAVKYEENGCKLISHPSLYKLFN